MSYESTLRDARRKRQELMTSTCVISRPSDSRSFNDDTGEYSDTPGTPVYNGPCQFKAWSPVGQRTGDVVGRELVSTMYDLVLPHGEYDISESDSVVVSGRTYYVNNVDLSEDRTAVHITVVDQARGSVDWA